MKREDIDLNAPAFGPGSEPAEKVVEEQNAEPIEPSVEDPTEEVRESEETVEPSVEENKVPYSRFKNIHQRALEAERIAAEYQNQLEILKSQREVLTQENSEVPSFWVEMYGDSEASKKAWKLQQEQNELIKKQAREEAIAAVREEKEREVKAQEENLSLLDNHLELVSGAAGRDLTEKEQDAILGIIDEYTPKDDSGNYAGALLSPEKAWEIYELKNQVSKAPKKQARDSVAALSGSETQGEPSVSKDKSKDFNPLNWGAWRNRV